MGEQPDSFSHEVTGAPDLVINTLSKFHTLNTTPHELKPSDEIISSHPSLEPYQGDTTRLREHDAVNPNEGTETLPA